MSVNYTLWNGVPEVIRAEEVVAEAPGVCKGSCSLVLSGRGDSSPLLLYCYGNNLFLITMWEHAVQVTGINCKYRALEACSWKRLKDSRNAYS
jgi:hypothetical protein